MLDNLDLTQTISDEEFEHELARLQARLNMLQRRAGKRGVSTILVFEGWDAAGKGGAIRRVTGVLMPAITRSFPSRRRTTRNVPITICGDSGDTSHEQDA